MISRTNRQRASTSRLPKVVMANTVPNILANLLQCLFGCIEPSVISRSWGDGFSEGIGWKIVDRSRHVEPESVAGRRSGVERLDRSDAESASPVFDVRFATDDCNHINLVDYFLDGYFETRCVLDEFDDVGVGEHVVAVLSDFVAKRSAEVVGLGTGGRPRNE